MLICYAYEEDLDQLYSFYCARYEKIKFDDFLKLGYEEFKKLLKSIPETEPLYKVIKSRTIDLNKIKNKEERDYWRDLKKVNAIPDEYKSEQELDYQLRQSMKGINL